MKTLIAIAAIVALPAVATAQSQLGNSMGTQSSAAPSSSMRNDPSNADKTPTAMSGGSSHHATRKHRSHGHGMSGSGSQGMMVGTNPK